MAQELVIVEDEEDLGPSMRALTALQRRFVYAMLITGGQKQTNAALAAGYAPTSAATVASQLMHNERVLAALHEEATKRLRSGVLLGASVLMEIAGDPMSKDRFKAACRLLDQAGLTIKSEQTIVVKHTRSQEETIASIRTMATQLGLDPKVLLGNAGIVIDAEFEDVSAKAKPAVPALEKPQDQQFDWTYDPEAAE